MEQAFLQVWGRHSGCWAKRYLGSVKRENYGSFEYDDLYLKNCVCFDPKNRGDLDLKNRGDLYLNIGDDLDVKNLDDLDEKNVEECAF